MARGDGVSKNTVIFIQEGDSYKVFGYYLHDEQIKVCENIIHLKRKIHCLHLSFITICTNIMKRLFYLMATQLYMSTK